MLGGGGLRGGTISPLDRPRSVRLNGHVCRQGNHSRRGVVESAGVMAEVRLISSADNSRVVGSVRERRERSAVCLSWHFAPSPLIWTLQTSDRPPTEPTGRSGPDTAQPFSVRTPFY